LGFPRLVITDSLRTIAHLFPNTVKRCGIYILKLRDNTYYIGQSKDVVRRYVAHLKAHEKIIGFSFLPVAVNQLDTVEQELIFKAQRLCLVLSNNTHVSHVIGETDLDLVVSRLDQDVWLKNPGTFMPDTSKRIVLSDGHLAAFKRQYNRLKASEHHRHVVDILRLYINQCIIAPSLTEYSFWSVSCCPSTNRNTRLTAVNAGMMELFVLGFFSSEPNTMWGFVNVAESVLERDAQLLDLLENEGLSPIRVGYRDGANDCCQIEFIVGESDWILRDRSVMRAAAELALRIMRKRATIYCKYHCKQLADEVLSGL